MNLLIKIKKYFFSFLFYIFKYHIKKTVASFKGKIYIGGPTYLTRTTYLGENVNFNGMRVIGLGNLIIGDNFHSGSDCLIITSNHNYRGIKLPYDDSNIIKNVIIGNNVWIGNRVIILPGVTISDGVIIQAGSVVSSDIPFCAIAGGNPAKVFRNRDIDHYSSLLKNKMFH